MSSDSSDGRQPEDSAPGIGHVEIQTSGDTEMFYKVHVEK